MAARLLETPVGDEAVADPRWRMVDRIVVSSSFARSERLSSFLLCVCELAQQGRQDEINEQRIGTAVFERRPGYDPSVDSIVRSHASRLRHRLARYFEEEGADEEWILEIPKGSYLPVFRRRLFEERVPAEETPAMPEAQPMEPETAAPVVVASLPAELPETTGGGRVSTRVLGWALAAMTLVALLGVGAAVYEFRGDTVMASSLGESERLFWTQLFNAHEPTVVVIADSGLVMLQGFTKKPVSLPMYLNGTYLKTVPEDAADREQALDLATRRYTSIVDLLTTEHLLRLPGLDLRNTRFVYARDLRPSDVKQGNLLLLGTYESTPWVQLFEPGMNFYFRNDLKAGVFSAVNRNPEPGEQATYDSRTNDPEKVVYGVVAYRPSLNGTGKVLILEGQSMAGTESASDYVFNSSKFLPFLESIRRRDGTVPYFEILVESRSMSGESSRLEVVAKRVEDH